MRVLCLLAVGAAVGALVGCGARTGLPVPGDETPPEAGFDAVADSTVDAPLDVDVHDAHDASDARDAGPDVFDAPPDAPVDAPPDAFDASDAHPVPPGCEDAGTSPIFVITVQGDLWSFYPPGLPNAAFRRIGHINCPTAAVPVGDPLPTPFSMAVDHAGTAFVVFSNGQLFRVSTATAQCAGTTYVPIPDGKPFHTFGMGFSENTVSTGEALFIASDNFNDAGVPSELGLIDTTTLRLSALAAFPTSVQNAELTGTGGGDLFAFYSTNTSLDYQQAPSWIGRIDKQTAKVTNSFPMPTLAQGCGWAFAYWGGDFYMFTAPLSAEAGATPTCPPSTQPQPQTVVTRFRPSDNSTAVVVPLFAEEIVGAGVSTCAPQQ